MSTHLTSLDGTTLAVDTVGQGRPLVLIGGAFNDRSTVAGLAAELASRFQVVTYDRRGRSASDNKSAEYRVADELDDLAAVLDHVGGGAAVFGHSSGSVLALEAVLHGLPIDRIAVYEPPYRVPGTTPLTAADLADRIEALVVTGQQDAAVELFLAEAVGVPPEMVAGMRAGEGWPFLADKAASLPYDVLLMKPWQPAPTERLAAGIRVPLLASYGDRTEPGLAAATRAVAAAVPGAELAVLPGEDHAVLQRPAALAPTLTAFFG